MKIINNTWSTRAWSTRALKGAFALFVMLLCGAVRVSSQTASQSNESAPDVGQKTEIVLKSDVKWGPLNAARGEASPRAGTLWGDRMGAGPSGFLVQFREGFASPPHIHNITYRGVVITGLIHNDDPDAENMWLPTGSYWSQPAGGTHITSANGNKNLAYIEIEDGPYLVQPTEQAFDKGESAINVDVSNLVWLEASDMVWIDQAGIPSSAQSPEIAFLWGSPKDGRLNGSLVKLPAGFTGEIRSKSSIFRAVVIQGFPKHDLPGGTKVKTLEPGSYFGSEGRAVHRVSVEVGAESVIYVRTDGKYEVRWTKPNSRR